MVSEKKIFLSFSHYKSMGDNDPQGMASLGPRGLIGRIYVGDHSWLDGKFLPRYLPVVTTGTPKVANIGKYWSIELS